MKTIKASTVVREVRRYIGKVPLPEEMVTTEADRVESLSRTLPTDFVLKRAVSAVEDIVSRVSAMHVPALMTSGEAFWGGENGTFDKTVMRQLRGRVYRLPSGVTTVNYGDVNDDGDITSQDASLVLQHIDGSITLTPEQIERGDVDGDGVLTETDADLIQQYVVGLIDRFPAEDLVVEGVKARDGRWYFEYQVEDAGTNPSAFIYPKHLVGAGHQLRFKRFDTLYDFTLDMTPAPGEN